MFFCRLIIRYLYNVGTLLPSLRNRNSYDASQNAYVRTFAFQMRGARARSRAYV